MSGDSQLSLSVFFRCLIWFNKTQTSHPLNPFVMARGCGGGVKTRFVARDWLSVSLGWVSMDEKKPINSLGLSLTIVRKYSTWRWMYKISRRTFDRLRSTCGSRTLFVSRWKPWCFMIYLLVGWFLENKARLDYYLTSVTKTWSHLDTNGWPSVLNPMQFVNGIQSKWRKFWSIVSKLMISWLLLTS